MPRRFRFWVRPYTRAATCGAMPNSWAKHRLSCNSCSWRAASRAACPTCARCRTASERHLRPVTSPSRSRPGSWCSQWWGWSPGSCARPASRRHRASGAAVRKRRRRTRGGLPPPIRSARRLASALPPRRRVRSRRPRPAIEGPALAAASLAEAPNAAHRRPVELQLRFSADSWTEVYDADGRRLYYALAPANTERTLAATAPLRVVLGHAPGVQVSIDGKSAIIPEGALRRDVADFVVNAAGRLATER